MSPPAHKLPEENEAAPELAITKLQRIFMSLVLGWLVFTTSLVTLAVWSNPVKRALICMGWGLIVLWIFVCGGLMVRYRRPLGDYVKSIRLKWQVKFVIFCTLLAMLEEATTTGMTNAAPLFGLRIGQAYITASANYWDVITLHSVSVFVPLFVGWAVLLHYFRFRPFDVFLLFGCSGIIAEVLFAGPAHFLEFALWIPVYGLMVYLPAFTVPSDRVARGPRWWLYPLAIFIPFLFLPLFPIALIPHLLHPNHPSIDFPPMK
jgi:hypothetical protein